MSTSVWRLTVEEIALLMSLRKQPELAQELLQAQLGPLTKENVEGRLYAAGHTLIARDELAVAVDGSIHIGEEMTLLTQILLDAPHSLRYTRSYRNADLLLTYHFYQGVIYEHRLVQGVVHEIEAVADSDKAVASGIQFFGLDDANMGASLPVEIDAEVWNELSAQKDYPQLVGALRSLGTLNGNSEWLAADLLSASYRGTVLWVAYTQDKQPVSDHGFLMLGAPQRTWLIEPKQLEAGAVMQLQQCSASLFAMKVKQLCLLA